jgi:deoxyribonuclease V
MGRVCLVAGVDAAYDERHDQQVAAAVVLDADDLNLIEYAIAREAVRFPYIPGLFAFRELPTILQALNKLNRMPDLIVCDGQGLAHPRRFGLACHLGVLCDIATIGCSKTPLTGEAKIPGPNRGDRAPLADGDEIVGAVLRTQDSIKPVYVSVGHRVSLNTACQWILRLASRYRLPQTTRRADQIVRRHILKRCECATNG